MLAQGAVSANVLPAQPSSEVQNAQMPVWRNALGAGESQTTAPKAPVSAEARSRAAEAFVRSPLHFEPNQGQISADVKFLTRAPGYQLYLTTDEAILALRSQFADQVPSIVRMRLIGDQANHRPVLEALDALAGRSHYYVGNDPQRWRTDIPHFAKVRYNEVYPGVDWVLYGNPRRLEYDFVVAPGADPNLINLSLAGADEARIAANGELVVSAAGKEILHSSPTIYQVVNGERQRVDGRYVLRESVGNAPVVGFEIAAYDRQWPLVIDPVVYFTFVGGAPDDDPNDIAGIGGDDLGLSVAVNSAGNAYITGSTSTNNAKLTQTGDEAKRFPITANAIDPSFNLGTDVFVTRLDATGAIVYSTYFGGSGFEAGYGIAVDGGGSVYVTGYTNSSDFSVTLTGSALQGSQDAFVTKIKADGTLGYSTYLGGTGSEAGYGVAVNNSGEAYVTGYTSSSDSTTSTNNFPGTGFSATTPKAAVGEDAFIVKVNAAGNGLLYSTLTNFPGNDRGQGIVLDASGTSAYITGFRNSPTNEAAFVAKVSTTGAISYSANLDGTTSNEHGLAISRDDLSPTGVYIAGYTSCSTSSCGTSPSGIATIGVYDTTFNGPAASQDAFVAKYEDSGSVFVLKYATYLGGQANDVGYGIAVDSFGNAYVAGETFSPDFPLVGPDDDAPTKGEAFLSRLNQDGTQLTYSSLWGGAENDSGRGLARDFANDVYMVGYTNSPKDGFSLDAITPYRDYIAGADAFVAKFSIPIANIYNLSVKLTGSGSGAVTSVPKGIGESAGCRQINGVVDESADCDADYVTGTKVTLSAIALEGSAFVGWSGSGSGVCAGSSALTCEVTMTEAKLVVANFSAGFQLSVKLTGNGSGAVTSVPEGIGGSPECRQTSGVLIPSAGCDAGYATGTKVTLSAIALESSSFSGWSGSGSGTCAGSSASTCEVTMDAAKLVVANFSPPLSLTITTNGDGTVTSSPVGITCGADCQDYPANTQVTLTATPTANSVFGGWGGDCSGTTPITKTVCLVTMGVARNVTATFKQAALLTVKKDGGGAGTVSGGGTYATGTTVNLTAVPDTGSIFAGWTPSPCANSFPMPSSALTCTATFAPVNSPDLVVSSLTSPATGQNANRTVNFSLVVKNQGEAAAGAFKVGLYWSTDTTITLSDDVSAGYECSFSGLAKGATATCSGNLTLPVGTGTEVSPVGLAAGTYYLGAYADPNKQSAESDETNNGKTAINVFTVQTLKVTVGKPGAGKVYSTPAGIACNSADLNSCSAAFLDGGTAKLTATPTGDSTFTGWGGACSGTSTCTVTMNASKSVTATFSSSGSLSTMAVGVFRAGTWFLDANSNGAWDGCDVDRCYVGSFGQAGDLPVAGDWNGDGKAKVGVFRAGTWYLDYNGNGSWDGCDVDRCYVGSFGQAGDLPAAGDWNGDGKAKVGVFRAGTWYLDYNGNGSWDGCDVDRCYVGSFGQAGDAPVAGDWNGDSKAKIGVFRDGVWFLDTNGNGQWDGCQQDGGQDQCLFNSFGQRGDLPVAGRW